MIREAVKGDETLIESYLAKHFTSAMFMRGNLRDFGIGNTEAPYGMRFFIREEDEVTGIGGVGNGGAVMLQSEDNPAELVAHMRATLPVGFKPNVTTGAPEMVAAIISGFGMVNAPAQMDETEPLRKKLSDLKAEHRQLDDEISGLLESGNVDQLEIKRLKKRKLSLKDEILQVENQLLPDIIA